VQIKAMVFEAKRVSGSSKVDCLFFTLTEVEQDFSAAARQLLKWYKNTGPRRERCRRAQKGEKSGRLPAQRDRYATTIRAAEARPLLKTIVGPYMEIRLGGKNLLLQLLALPICKVHLSEQHLNGRARFITSFYINNVLNKLLGDARERERRAILLFSPSWIYLIDV